MIVAKWGNSLAVRIPADIARELGIKEGDDVTLRASGDALEVVTERQRLDAAIAKLDKYQGWMPDDFKFDRDEANVR